MALPPGDRRLALDIDTLPRAPLRFKYTTAARAALARVASDAYAPATANNTWRAEFARSQKSARREAKHRPLPSPARRVCAG